jgi:hypothetical protein
LKELLVSKRVILLKIPLIYSTFSAGMHPPGLQGAEFVWQKKGVGFGGRYELKW